MLFVLNTRFLPNRKDICYHRNAINLLTEMLINNLLHFIRYTYFPLVIDKEELR